LTFLKSLVVSAIVLTATGALGATPDAATAGLPIAKTQAGNYLAALVASADRDAASAAVYYSQSLKFDPLNVEIMGRAFASSLASGEIDKAAALADKFVQRDPHNGLARLALAVRAFAQGQYGQARAHLAAGAPIGRTKDLVSIMLTAWAYAGAKDERHALDALDQIGEKSLGVFKDYHAGLIADALGDSKEAEARLKSAYSADQGTLRIVDAYARTLARHGDVEGAKKVYEDFAKTTAKHPMVEAALADLKAGKKLEPIAHDAREGAAEALYGIGGAGRGEGDELAPLVYLRLALYLRPDHDLAAATIADLFEQYKQPEQEIAAYRLVPTSSPMRESADIQAAIALDGLGRNGEATALMQKLVNSKPDDLDAVMALADLQRSSKAYEAAIKTYDKALELVGAPTKTNWALLYFRGICHERAKQWPLAEADFQKALELYPDQPLVLNYLGYSWIDQGTHYDEAFQMLHKAVELKPDDGYIVDSLGWAHFKLGHFDQALDYMEKAVSLKAADPTINDHLGDVYWRLGRTIEARFQWNHARDMKPEPEDLPTILNKIADGLPPLPSPTPAVKAEATPAPAPAPEPSATPSSGG
jgi:tetratricopeptide (TPR) repeat protein